MPLDDMPRLKPAVSYIRVSTQRQHASGLGEDAQRESVAHYAAANGYRILAEFREVESGKNDSRPELARAINECRLRRATLLIAKIDRLARRVSFVSTLMESGLDFRAVDFPQATKLTVHLLASMAEHEREQISSRVTAALSAAKRRGTLLGTARQAAGLCGPRPFDAATRAEGQRIGADANRAKAVAFAERVADAVEEITKAGAKSLREIARGLEQRGVKPPKGETWSAAQVRRLLARLPAKVRP